MSPPISQMGTRSENGEKTAQNPCTRSCADSTPMCKIKIFGNQLAPKLDDVIMIFFENVNVLPISKYGCHSDKVSMLRYFWSNLNVEFLSLVET